MLNSWEVPARRPPGVGSPHPQVLPCSDSARPLDGLGSIAVLIPGRQIRVAVAREQGDFEQAFRLNAGDDQAKGYSVADSRPFRFTPFYLLPDTATFVARDGDRVVATLSLVPDTRLLGLPMESTFGPEVEALRNEGRRLGEVTGLADRELAPGEFIPVFMSLIRLMLQFHLRQGGDTWALAVNPRRGAFYRKVLGAIRLESTRSFPSGNDHPAEAYWFDTTTLKINAPPKYVEFFSEDIPVPVLAPHEHRPGHAQHFVSRSDLVGQTVVEEILRSVEHFGSPPRWVEG